MNERVDKQQLLNPLIKNVKSIVWGSYGSNKKLLNICKLLSDSVPYYDWVGFYLVSRPNNRELVFGPFVGEPTEHT